MVRSTPVFEQIVTQVQDLAPVDQLRLITRIAERLASSTRSPALQPLVYGIFHGERLSTEEDFRIAEWQPSERAFDGKNAT